MNVMKQDQWPLEIEKLAQQNNNNNNKSQTDPVYSLNYSHNKI